MRKLLLASIALGTLVAPALAADLSTPPPYKVAPIPIYNWTGFYVGANLGGAWTRDAFSQGPAADAQSGTINTAGIVGGGQIGFNWQVIPAIVLGVEADIDGADLNNNVNTSGAAGVTLNWREKVDFYGTARGRLGYAWNNWLFYGTGGFAWAGDNFTRTQLTQAPTTPLAGFSISNDPGRIGWTAGGGIEWAFARNWTARVEYLHLDFNDAAFTFSTAAVGGGTATRNIDEGRLTVDTVRVGVNYLFH
jgi:outer membrane immunogenic protein